MSSLFDGHYREYDAWYDKHRLVFLSQLEAIKKVLPEKGSGLEIGVGTGRFAHALGIRTGIDPSESMIQVAKRRGIDVCQALGESLPFKDSTFDYAAIIIALCFAQYPLKLLKETNRALKKNGQIIIGIVDKDSFLGNFYRKKKSPFYKKAHFFTVKNIIDMLRTAGFKGVSCYQTVFDLPDKIHSVEKPQESFGKGGFVVISANSYLIS